MIISVQNLPLCLEHSVHKKAKKGRKKYDHFSIFLHDVVPTTNEDENITVTAC